MKSSNTTTALALSAMPSIQPKPTKTEILNAMMARAKVRHDKENDRRIKRRGQLTVEITALAQKTFKAKTFTGSPSIDIQEYNSDKWVDLKFRVKSDALTALIVERKSLGQIVWEENVIKQEIRREIEGRQSSRLLDDPNVVKSIDAMLEEWGI